MANRLSRLTVNCAVILGASFHYFASTSAPAQTPRANLPVPGPGVAETPPADNRIELHVWGMNLAEVRYGTYAVVARFEEKYPNVKVILGPTDRGEDLQKLLCGVVGNAPPDVFRRESNLFGDIAARDILLSLEPFIETDKSRPDGLYEVDYPPGVWASGHYNDIMYAIPESSNPLVLGYNKRLFREAGLDPDRPPRTWDEWIEATRKLTREGANGQIDTLGTAIHARDDLAFYIAQIGGQVLSEDGRTCRLNSPEGVQALTFLGQMFDGMGGRRAYNDFVVTNPGTDIYNPFAMGRIAMSVEDDWIIFRAMQYAPDMELGVAPVPAPAGRPTITQSATNGMYMIPRNARHPNEAWDFVRYMNSPESQIIMLDTLKKQAMLHGGRHMYPGFRPNRKVLEELSARFAPREPPFDKCFETCKQILDTLVPVTISPVTAVLRDEMRRAVERVSYHEVSPQQALNDATHRVQEQLALFYGRERAPLLEWWYVWLAFFVTVLLALAVIVIRTRSERAFSSLQRRENRTGPLFVLPWVLGFLVFTAGPMVFSFAMSFCDYDVIHPARWVGIRNYTSLVLKDPLFTKSLANTVFMVLALPLGMATSLSIALLLNTKVRGMSVYRTIFYLPAITPAVATAVLWYALLNPSGIINTALSATVCGWLGINPPAWLQDPAWSKPALVLMGLWGAGGGMILWLAGLQGIPQQLYEAAAIDGAGTFRQFRSITLPMLTPYIFFSLIVGIIGVFQIFAQALVLTLGGPADSTLFYVYYLFNCAFRYFKMGYASAQAWILFVIVLLLTLIQWKLSKRWVHYG
ncbi:MAG: extracellular solute-binding protein [Candidatus Hydrogenedentes bacterium]|nr:extracellular solute-binding protein [Candidatus Hydrogenedentota bacterium]